VFWFLFWFEGDLIHFQTTIFNRVEKEDSPKTPDLIDDLRRLPEKINGARGGGRTHNLRLRSKTTVKSNPTTFAQGQKYPATVRNVLKITISTRNT
jgi:hypothetical protein